MRDKLPDMSHYGLLEYITKWEKKLASYQQGSKNWKKCNRRITRAKKLLK